MVIVRGVVNFKGGKPATLPDGSTLTVKLQDTRLMDAPAITLGTFVQSIKDYNGEDLAFEIKAEIPESITLTLSAVLNQGWTPSGDEWIRRGDYLNDTTHDFAMKDGKNEYVQNIEVVRYT